MGTGVLVGFLVGGFGVLVGTGGTGVSVGATVAVGGTGVAVGGTAVAVGGTAVAVGGTAVAVAGTGVLVGGTAVAVGTAVFTTTDGTTPPLGGVPCPPTITVVVWEAWANALGLVMKAVTPLFRKKHSMRLVPFAITGAYGDTSVKVDWKRVL